MHHAEPEYSNVLRSRTTCRWASRTLHAPRLIYLEADSVNGHPVCMQKCRMARNLTPVEVTYDVEHEGILYRKKYVIRPLALDGETFLYYCPFEGCRRHPTGTGCSRATINLHGHGRNRCDRATYSEPVCNTYDEDNPWFELRECKPAQDETSLADGRAEAGGLNAEGKLY